MIAICVTSIVIDAMSCIKITMVKEEEVAVRGVLLGANVQPNFYLFEWLNEQSKELWKEA
jgi:hypothetical protein